LTSNADEQALRSYGTALADGVDVAVAGWVVRCVEQVLGAPLAQDVLVAARLAGEAARSEVNRSMRALVSADVDDQSSTPLAVVRDAVRFPTAVLRSLGAAPRPRDDYSQQAFPMDIYDLTPASLAELDPPLGELAIQWGAAKAFVHKQRHRPPADRG
jgi:hypothetical protein